jgi:protocatechuate 3,4-dioxygenase alpha subunit
MAELLPLTPSQTVGPFFAIALPYAGGESLVEPATHGRAVRIEGIVRDGDGAAVPDALVEIWQANAAGRYAHPADERVGVPLDPAFIGFGRSATDAEGGFRFETVRPGRVPGPGGVLQAPHIVAGVFARGLLKRLLTRIYFEDEPANAEDPILALVEPARRSTLLARREADGDSYRFDIVLQGAHETVFFAC